MKIKVSILNSLSNNITHEASFDSNELAQDFIQRIQAMDPCPWGKPEREIRESDANEYELAHILSERSEDDFDLEGNVIGSIEYITVPAEYTVEITDISTQVEAEALKAQRKEAGKNAREACQGALDLISGYNQENELSLEDITEMQMTFGNIQAALMAGRPGMAKVLIEQVTPSDLVSQEMIDDVLSELSDY